MGCVRTTSKLFVGLVFVGINALLLLGGVLVLLIAMGVRETAWIEILEAYTSSTEEMIMAINIVGWSVIGLAVLGSVAACCRWRCGLVLYAILVAIVLLAFAGVAVVSFLLKGTMNDWNEKPYPADENEVQVREKFDMVYCYAQGAYVCNQMSLKDITAIFLPGIGGEEIAQAVSDAKGVNALCDAYYQDAASDALIRSVCDACKIARPLENVTSVLDWAEEKCPRNADTLTWCAGFLATNSLTNSMGTNPYNQCREPFLEMVESSARQVGFGSLIICGASLMIIFFTCFLRSRERQEQTSSTQLQTPEPTAGPILEARYQQNQGKYDRDNYSRV